MGHYNRRGSRAIGGRTWVFGGGGEGEIRTHEGREAPPVFKTGAFNRSATSPEARNSAVRACACPAARFSISGKRDRIARRSLRERPMRVGELAAMQKVRSAADTVVVPHLSAV